MKEVDEMGDIFLRPGNEACADPKVSLFYSHYKVQSIFTL